MDWISLSETIGDIWIETKLVTYKDRLTRFGFNYLKSVFDAYNVEIVVLNDARATRSVEQELTEDMMSLLASFSGKLYGIRSRKKKSLEYIETHDRIDKPTLKKLIAKEGERHEWDEGIYHSVEDRGEGCSSKANVLAQAAQSMLA